MESEMMEIKRDKEINYGVQGLFLVYGLPALFNILVYVTGIEQLGDYVLIIHMIKYVCLIPMLFYFFANKDVRIIAVISVLFMIIMLTAGINLEEKSTAIVSPVIYYVAYTMVTMICLSLLKNPIIILEKFRNIAYIGCIEIVVMCLCGNILHTYSRTIDYMVMGNSGLIYISVLVYWVLKEKKLLDIVLSGMVVVCYLLFTSRGSLGALAVVILYYVLFGNTGISLKKRTVWLTIMGALGGILLINLRAILTVVADIATQYGWGMGKLLQSFLYMGNIFQSLSRVEIWTNAMSLIKENWLAGCGPMASVKLMESYAHNMELDILLDYGVVLGGLLIIGIWVLLIVLLFGKKYRKWSNVCATFVLPGFIVLQLSGYWYSTSYIFVLLYLFCLARRENIEGE